jgi:hypothetical protein
MLVYIANETKGFYIVSFEIFGDCFIGELNRTLVFFATGIFSKVVLEYVGEFLSLRRRGRGVVPLNVAIFQGCVNSGAVV